MYSHSVLGGTFDHLHAGHKDLLSFAFSSGKRITLGLTRSSMNGGKKLSAEIESYAKRKESILSFARQLGRETDLKIIPIHNIYGSTLTDSTLEAIVVTPHTQGGADQINRARTQQGLATLPVLVCPLHLDSHGEVLCSSNIRAGKVDRQGLYFEDFFREDRELSEDAKKELKHPFGKPWKKSTLRKSRDLIMLIGDVVTNYHLTHGISFDIAYIDGSSQKTPYTHPTFYRSRIQTPSLHNQAGTISTRAASHILSFLHGSTDSGGSIFSLTGEEDLLTVAAVILAPFGTKIIYGYPYAQKGMRTITVGERIKEKFAHLLSL